MAADRPTMTRTIIMCEPERYIHAVRTVKYMLKHIEDKDCFLTFEDGTSMFAKRNPKSIKVVQVQP